jgi:hypothetical protein
VTDAVAGDEEHRDSLPEDLDASGYVGPYTFPDIRRRRIPGWLYLGFGGLAVLAWVLTQGDDPVLVNEGFLVAGVVLIAIALYHFAAGWPLEIDQHRALDEAARTAGFPVGHASAQLGWRGLRSRPTWRVLLYSAEDPPKQRGFVLVDGVDGTVLEHFVEDNPEDWTDIQKG